MKPFRVDRPVTLRDGRVFGGRSARRRKRGRIVALRASAAGHIAVSVKWDGMKRTEWLPPWLLREAK